MFDRHIQCERLTLELYGNREVIIAADLCPVSCFIEALMKCITWKDQYKKNLHGSIICNIILTILAIVLGGWGSYLIEKLNNFRSLVFYQHFWIGAESFNQLWKEKLRTWTIKTDKTHYVTQQWFDDES